MNRRDFLAGAGAAAAAGSFETPSHAAARPSGPLVDTHVHLFSQDLKRFPLSPHATYKPTPLPVEEYVRFAKAAGIDHAVIVHPRTVSGRLPLPRILFLPGAFARLF